MKLKRNEELAKQAKLCLTFVFRFRIDLIFSSVGRSIGLFSFIELPQMSTIGLSLLQKRNSILILNEKNRT